MLTCVIDLAVKSTSRGGPSADREIDLFLGKRRLACGNGDCPRGTFTEWVPQVSPRCRVTRRLLEHCGDEVAERGITPAESAWHNAISWPSAHAAFSEKADTILGEEPELAVKAVGDVRRRAIRELYGRRGKAGDPEYGIKHLLEKNLENLSPEQFGKVIETLDSTGPGHGLSASNCAVTVLT